MAGVRRGRGWGKTRERGEITSARSARGAGKLRDASKDAIVFFVFYAPDMDVKILIGQICVSVKILLFGGILTEVLHI